MSDDIIFGMAVMLTIFVPLFFILAWKLGLIEAVKTFSVVFAIVGAIGAVILFWEWILR